MNSQIAEAYGRHSQKYPSILEPLLRPMADEILHLGRMEAAELVLDLATGTGLIARTAVPAGKSIIGVDISLGILAIARSLSTREIPLVAGNSHKLPFKDHCFDLVTCGLSLSHFSDVLVALGEVRRILPSGGCFIASAWGSEREDPSYSAATEVKKKYLKDKDDPFEGALDEEKWSDVERGCYVLRLAGFENVQATTIPLSGKYQNPFDAVEWAFAWPLTRYRIAELDPMDQQKLRQETVSSVLEVDDLCWQADINYYQAV